MDNTIKVKHYKNGKVYKIRDMCKIQKDGIWIDAVIYSELDKDELYCRNLQEFNFKFKIV